MNNSVRLRSKYLLSQNTGRLFFASTLSFILRWCPFALSAWSFYYCLSSDIFKEILSGYNSTTILIVISIIFSVLFFLCGVSAAAIKTGEQFLYLTRAQGAKGSLKLLFKYLHPKKAFRAFRYCLTVNCLKLTWFVYFFTPVAICTGILFYVYNSAFRLNQIYLILSICCALLFAMSFVVWRICVFRYGAALYYLCLKPDMKVFDAIKKSIRYTDGFLTDGVLLEYSHCGWLLSCIFIIPLVYVVPYIKLTKGVFITENIFSQSPSYTSTYSVNLLKLIPSGKHINQRHYE